MKLYKKIILGLASCVMLASCNDWLDVNKNPNSASQSDATYEMRLPWCQFYMNHIYYIVASNSSFYCGHYYRNNAREGGAAKWLMNASKRNSTAQQWFYVGVGSNLDDLYNSAVAAEAWHYAAAAKFIRAYGFMMLTDLFSEIPYEDALGENPSPAYSTGKEVFMGCIADLEEAIELFQKPQSAVAQPLSAGDSWNNGDVDKWIRLCYLVKARWLNHLNKKAAGSYKDGKYDQAEILACLEKAQRSNADNTLVRHTDTNTNTHDVLGWNEPVDYNPLYSCIGMNSNIYITKCYYDNLTNFDGKGIEDPRADKMIPWARSEKTATTPAEIKWSDNGEWRRSMGVDMQSNIISQQGPYALSYDATTDKWYCNSASRQGDTIYVWLTAGSTGYAGGRDILYRRNSTKDRSAMSGVVYDRPTTPSVVGSYSEACFIKAEVLFNQGNKNEAYNAYREGVKAHIEFVNDLVKGWYNEDSGNALLTGCPTFIPMTDDAINNFLDNALGTAADLTLGKIMTQKMIAMPFSEENWNDMRRLDYNKEIFMAWDIPYEYYNTPSAQTYLPIGKYPRRWEPASYETSYNTASLNAIVARVPALQEFGEGWFNNDLMRTIPVWWDSTQE